jgi:hypothetical protein
MVVAIVLWLSCSASSSKICWMAARVAATRPPIAGDAVPNVSEAAAVMPTSSVTNVPSSTHAASLACSMSRPHRSTVVPMS